MLDFAELLFIMGIILSTSLTYRCDVASKLNGQNSTLSIKDVVTSILEYRGSLEYLRTVHNTAIENTRLRGADLELDKLLQEHNGQLCPYTIYCSLTGQHIGYLHREQVQTAITMYGASVSTIKTLKHNNRVELQSMFKTAPQWLFTGPKQLDELKKIDPYGFYMYCVGFLAKVHNQARKGTQWVQS